MRLTYIDESGTSSQEPIAVVCGVMVDGDGHLRLLDEHISELAKSLAPEFGPSFVFHAQDIWNGNGIFKGRTDWPFERRVELVKAIAAIPAKFDIPVSVGMILKQHAQKELKEPADPKVIGKVFHTLAFIQCCIGVEAAMRAALPDEISMLIAEDCAHIRGDLKEMHELLQSPEKTKAHGLDKHEELPFLHIKEGVLFADKNNSRCLQIADCCAFIIRAYLAGAKYRRDILEDLYKEFLPQLLQVPHEDGTLTRKHIKFAA